MYLNHTSGRNITNITPNVVYLYTCVGTISEVPNGCQKVMEHNGEITKEML